jgi:hypothetical protein
MCCLTPLSSKELKDGKVFRFKSGSDRLIITHRERLYVNASEMNVVSKQ